MVDLQTERILRTRLHDLRHRDAYAPGLAGPVCRVDLPTSAGYPPGNRVYPPLPLRQSQAQPVTGMDEEAEVYAAVTLGVHDYVNKNGFKRAFIGLSGGIDSSLTAAIAVDALGANRSPACCYHPPTLPGTASRMRKNWQPTWVSRP